MVEEKRRKMKIVQNSISTFVMSWQNCDKMFRRVVCFVAGIL